MNAHLRIARPTDKLEAIADMYRAGLGLDVLGSFEDHDGFDGIMLGRPGAEYHLEFTHQRGCQAGRAPSPENLLIFYLDDQAEWEVTCGRMLESRFKPVPSRNPYWDVHGRTFEDLDGYRVVLQCATWTRSTP